MAVEVEWKVPVIVATDVGDGARTMYVWAEDAMEAGRKVHTALRRQYETHQFLVRQSKIEETHRVSISVLPDHLVPTIVETDLRKRFDQDRAAWADKQTQPQVLVTLVKLPTGNVETIVNYVGILDKLAYLAKAYDDDFKLKSNPEVQIVGYVLY